MSLGYPLNGTIKDTRAVTGRLNQTKHAHRHYLLAPRADEKQVELSFLLLGILALGLVKFSVTFLYWHLFAMARFRRFLIVRIIILIGWTTAFILAGLLECNSHLKALFTTPQEFLHHRGSAIPSGWACVGSDIATDFITLIIPIPIVSMYKGARTYSANYFPRCSLYIFQNTRRFSLPLRSWLVHCTFLAKKSGFKFDIEAGPWELVS